MTSASAPIRFRDKAITFANGSTGETIAIPSASPTNYHHVITTRGAMPKVDCSTASCSLPPAGQTRLAGKLPLVIVVPGSLGVAPSHVTHAETLDRQRHTRLSCSTISAAAMSPRRWPTRPSSRLRPAPMTRSRPGVAAGRRMPEIDGTRIGAQGHSRGGSAVLTAATRRFADAVVGQGQGADRRPRRPIPGAAISSSTRASARPRCAFSWATPTNGARRCRRRDMCQAHAPCRSGSNDHDACSPARNTASTGAPSIVERARRPRCRRPRRPPISPTTAPSCIPIEADAERQALADRDLMVYGLKAGYGRKGAQDRQPRRRRRCCSANDMVAFWRRVLRAWSGKV